MKELPSFHPNTFGSTAGLAPIYCVSKEQWNFLATAVCFQDGIEPILKDLSHKKDCKKNLQFAGGMAQAITSVLNRLETNASSQAEYLAKQSLALERLLEKHCPRVHTLTPAPTVPHQKMLLS